MSRKARTCIVFIALVLIGVIAFFGMKSRRLVHSMTVEAGTELTASKFFRFGGSEATFKETPDVHSVGEREVTLLLNGKEYTSLLTVKDTVAPVIVTKEAENGLGGPVYPEMFIRECKDETSVTYEFITMPDVNSCDVQELMLRAVDEGGNEALFMGTLIMRPFRMECKINTGDAIPKATDYLLTDGSCSYVTDLSTIDNTKVGYYELEICFEGRNYKVYLSVDDRIAPTLSVKESETFCYGQKIDPMDFVLSVFDYSAYEVTGESSLPENTRDLSDLSTKQEFAYTVVATDVYGNETRMETKAILEPDHIAPVISGVHDIYIYLGESVSYKRGVVVTDNVDEHVDLTVDNSKVDLTTPGTYWVYYSATDAAGNTNQVAAYLNVAAQEYTEEDVYALADEILADILTEDMTVYEQLDAIYKWVQSHIGYISHSEKNDQIKAAYEGLKDHQGDCFVFAMSTKYLLTRAGIPNIDIKKVYIEGASSHYWNLVDYGEGWYHFDTTPRKDKTKFFCWTDAQLKEYSDGHKNSHKYDPTLYPAIN